MRRLRPLLRRTAYRTGALSLARQRVRNALTAVMFHRVMDPADPDFALADPVYTVSTPLFAQLLKFFRDHYAVVDLRHVLDAIDGKRALPRHALLITFDDGWADNLRYAAPLLKEQGLPAVIFVAAKAVQDNGMAWWQEEVFAVSRSGRLAAWLRELPERARFEGVDAVGAVTRLAMLDEAQRAELLATLPRERYHARMMMKGDELPRLSEFSIDVGLHGYLHVPLTDVADVRDELAHTSTTLDALTEGKAMTRALGCPHGRYDERVIAGARAAGVKAVFTSDKLLNATDGGMLTRVRPLGRLGMNEQNLAASPYRLDKSSTARWLWARDAL
jgi:peptidoglycan/xylan/chitin deacetylase (PgdA/CDA1 family)